MTFGQLIADARKQAGFSQKDLAAEIHKEDGSSISPQYLNDLERDRRNPPSDFLLNQFAQVLKLPEDYVFFIAGQFPADLRNEAASTRDAGEVVAAFRAFRRTLKHRSQHEVDS